MRTFRILLIFGLAFAVPLAASAQIQTTVANFDERDSHWMASGFVGTNFEGDHDDASVDFGGSLGYLWRGVAGAEFQANFAPDFNLEPGRSAALLGENPAINSYMFNAVGAVPLGMDRSWSPYVSGGFGVMTLRADALDAIENTEFEPDDNRPAYNIGLGVMNFGEGVGFRGDVRYFRAFEVGNDPITSTQELLGERVLSDLGFWRANIGLAFRW